MSFGEKKLKKKKINKFNSSFNKYYFSDQLNSYESNLNFIKSNDNTDTTDTNNKYVVSYIFIFIFTTLIYLLFSYLISYYFNNIHVDILTDVSNLVNLSLSPSVDILQKLNILELNKINLFKFLNII